MTEYIAAVRDKKVSSEQDIINKPKAYWIDEIKDAWLSQHPPDEKDTHHWEVD